MKNKGKWLLVSVLSACCYTSVGAVDSGTTLPTVWVHGERDNVYAGGMVGSTHRVGNLGEVEWTKSPLNTISLTRKVLDQNAHPTRAFFDAVTNHPSVQVGGCSTDNNVELQIRGMRFNTYDVLVDGLPGLMPMGNNSLNWVDRVEVTAGANAVWQGVNANHTLTGTINLVPKSAGEKDMLRWTETLAGGHVWTHALDMSTRLGKDRATGVRVNAMISRGNTGISRERIDMKNVFVHLDHRTADSYSTLLVGKEYSEHYGMPEILLLQSKATWGKEVTHLPDAKKVADNFMPAWSELSRSRKVVAFSHQQRLNKDLTAFLKYGFQSIDYPGYLDSKPKLLNDAGDYELSISGNQSQSRQLRHSLSFGLRGELMQGSIKHQWSAGFDRLSTLSDWAGGKNGTTSTVRANIYDTTALQTFLKPQVAPALFTPTKPTVYRSYYAVDHMSWDADRNHVYWGIRHQNIRTPKWERTAWLPTIAVLRKLNENWSLYGAYGSSLDTATAPKGAANQYEVLKPFQTKQYEVGTKYDFGKVGGSLSYFVVRQPQGILNDNNVYSMDGEVRHSGVEWNIFGSPTEHLHLQGGLMYLKSDLRRMQDARLNGKEAYGTSRIHATLGVEWETPVEGLALTGRWMYTGASWADKMNKIRVPAWHRLDVGAKYDFAAGGRKYQLNANVYNVLDRKYWSTMVVSWGESGLMLNPGRTYMVSLSTEF